jgi:uncharacterized ferritin-like protein (DUF455 family)
VTLDTLHGHAVGVLGAADPAEKCRRTAAAVAAWDEGRIAAIGDGPTPDRPARPARPALRPPREMPKRKATGSPAGRIALLHAVAHIELNAIDLAWDLIARFAATRVGDAPLPRAFFAEAVTVAGEEASHFAAVRSRLQALGADYGDLPAHDGMWDAARASAQDLAARLAVVPLVLEARGLDVTPAMIAALQRAGDDASAAVLQRIYDEEIGHVAFGRRWFEFVCAARGEDPTATYHRLVRTHYKAPLKHPFNREARDRAGLSAAFYAPLAAARG